MNMIMKIGLLFLLTLLISACNPPAIWNGNNPHKNKIVLQQIHSRLTFSGGEVKLNQSQQHLISRLITAKQNIKTIFLANCSQPTSAADKLRIHAIKHELDRQQYYGKIVVIGGSAITSENSTFQKRCINITIHRYRVIPPTCPDTKQLHTDYDSISSNFGCSTAHNLGVIVANPKQIYEAQHTDQDFSAQRLTIDVDKYYQGEKTELQPQKGFTNTDW